METIVSGQCVDIKKIAINTDEQGLARSSASHLIRLGGPHSQSRNPRCVGELALQCRPQLESALRGANLVFISAGLGGKTGTGAAPVVAKIAREIGAVVIAVAFTPLSFEDAQCKIIADAGMQTLRQEANSVFSLSAAKLEETGRQMGLTDLLRAYDSKLSEIVVMFAQLFHRQSNFAPSLRDLKTVMGKQGRAIMGTGVESGPERTRLATAHARADLAANGLNSTAHGLLIILTVSRHSRLVKPSQIMAVLANLIAPEAPVVIGTVFDEAMGENLRVCLIATGV